MLDFDSDGNTPPLLAENTSSEQYIDSVSYLSDEDVMSDKENRNQERNSQIISDSLSVPSEDSSINIEPVNDPNSPDPPDENVNLNGFCMIRVGKELPDGLTRDVRSL